MIPKYHIEYALELGGHCEPHVRSYQTDDPVACEAFLVAALEHGIKIKAIRHEGVEVSQREFDVLVRNAATTLAAKYVARSLELDAEQVHYRFGLAA